MKKRILLSWFICLIGGFIFLNGSNAYLYASKGSVELFEELDKLSKDKVIRFNDVEMNLSDKEWTELVSAYEQLQKQPLALPKERGIVENQMRLIINGVPHNIVQMKCKYDSYILVDEKAEYECTDALDKIFSLYSKGKSVEKEKSPEQRLIGLSIKCKEPTNKNEYLSTAQKIVAIWLDSLKNEKGRYQLKSYHFVNDLNDNRSFLGDGYINGGKEFVCYVAFDTNCEDEESAFYASGTYDTFYHYYFGPGVFARFRWENGNCTLIDYDEAFSLLTSDRLKSGLYGVKNAQNQYKTFFDFMNDKENVNKWLNKEIGSGLCIYTYSHNVTMLSNGEVIFVDIGSSDNGAKENKGMVTAEMDQYFYAADGEDKYSSPVDFIDGKGAVTMTYRNPFPLVFGDYNHDGHPDYTIRISSDKYGSTYDVRCIDGGGTPWEDSGEIYVYGEFSESIRLQVSDTGKILNKTGNNHQIKYEEVNLLKDLSNSVHDKVTNESTLDYRMYSQKFYLPEVLRVYGPSEKKVICYFWNNTDSKVAVGGTYEIERKNGEKWEVISKGKSIKSIDVNKRSCAELAFDITDIVNEEISLYRIKMNAGSEIVYGGFYKGNRVKESLEVSEGKYALGTNQMSFTIKNPGLSAVYPTSIALYRGTQKVYEEDVNTIGSITSGGIRRVNVSSEDVQDGLNVGEYKLVVKINENQFSGKATILDVPKERRYYFSNKIEVKKEGEKLKLPITNNSWTETSARIHHISEVQVMKNGSWYYALYELDNFSGKEVKYGASVDIIMLEKKDHLKELRSIYDTIINSKPEEYIDAVELAKIKKLSFEEFTQEAFKFAMPEKGDLCRVNIMHDESEEYVYFNMP